MVIINPLHKRILKKLNKLSPKGDNKERLWVQKYLGTNKPTRCIKTGEVIKLAKTISKDNNLDSNKLINLLDSLYSKATTFEELDMAARLLGVNPKLRQTINPERLDYWLNFTHGWAETDLLCQSNFSAEEILNNWKVWQKLLNKLVKDKNVHKKRASLVLLTKAVRQSDDQKLADQAFINTDKLKNEKDILITKAISWLLRSLIKNHRKEVADYLKNNQDKLPKIAIREVTNKLITGRKNNHLNNKSRILKIESQHLNSRK